MSRTVLALVAIGGVVIAVALGVAWRGKMSDQAAIGNAAKPAPTGTPAAPAIETKPAPNRPPASAISAPTIQVARLGADERAALAGRATPGPELARLSDATGIDDGDARS